MTNHHRLAACALLAALSTGTPALANNGTTGAFAPLAPATAQGAGADEESRLDYNYIWARWASGDGSLLQDGNGFNVEGAFEVGKNVHLYGDFDFIDFDDDVVELTRWSAAVGLQTPGTGPLSAYARAGFGSREYDGFTNNNDDGVFLSGGLRFLPIDPLEIEVRYSYTGSQPKYDSWRVGATLQVTESIGLGAAYDLGDEVSDDLNTLYAGVRISI